MRSNSLVHLKESFIKSTLDTFHISTFQQDFTREISIARHNLNQWIEKETNGKIDFALEEGDIPSGTQSILISTLAFQGQFKHEFSKVRLGNFMALQHGSDEMLVQCEMMERTKCEEVYGEEETFTWISIPYSGDRFHLLIMLPKEGLKLDDHYDTMSIIRKSVSPSFPKSNMRRVVIPKFTIKSQFKIDKYFKNAGITDIFDQSLANFQPISEDHISLNNVIQEVCFGTMELGTYQSGPRVLEGPWNDFIANRAFSFAVYDSNTRSTIFDGVLYNPTMIEKFIFE